MRQLLTLAIVLLASTAWANMAPNPAQFCTGKSVGEACTVSDAIGTRRPGTCQNASCWYSNKVDSICLNCVAKPQDLYAMPTDINWLAAAAGPIVLIGLLANWLIHRRRRGPGAGRPS